MDPRTDLFLVRHGQSEYNRDGRWQGHSNPPLSERGRREAHEAAARLPEVTALFSSDLERARATAEIFQQRLSMASFSVEPALRERDVGPWAGLTDLDIERQWPGYLESGRRPDGFEDNASVLRRAVPALLSIAERHVGATVLVVSHGGVIRALEAECGARGPRLANLEASRFSVLGRRLTWVQRVHLHPTGAVPRSGPAR
jgi:broad specificity phosphatase PhoE